MMQHLVLEAFGEFTPGESLSASGTADERDDVFLRMFDAYARVMGWASASSRPDSPALWNLRSAELASHKMDDPRAAWVWVSLRTPQNLNLAAPTTNGNGGSPMFSHRTVPHGPAANPNLADAVPALVSCLQVSLDRLGDFTLTGFQLTCLDMNTGAAPDRKGQSSAQDDLVSALPYLARRDSDRTQSVLAFDERLVAAGIQRELLSRLGEDGDAWPFVFGPPALVVEQFRVRAPLFTPRPGFQLAPGVPGLLMDMPEWSAEAAGWVLAFVSDVASEAVPGVGSFAIRLTRGS